MLIAVPRNPVESFKKLHEAGCIQTLCDVYADVDEAMKNGLERFCSLMILTTFDPCVGCPALNGRECKAFQQYHSAPQTEKAEKELRIKSATTPTNGPFGDMSVKQIAKKYNISVSEVRRLKVQGKLETLIKDIEEEDFDYINDDNSSVGDS